MWLVESLEKGKVGSRIPNIKYKRGVEVLTNEREEPRPIV